MISTEIISSAAKAHRFAILTSAVLALSGNAAIIHIASAVQTLAQGLTASNKVAVRPLSPPGRLEPCTVFSVRFVRAILAQPPSNVGKPIEPHKVCLALIRPTHKPYFLIA